MEGKHIKTILHGSDRVLSSKISYHDLVGCMACRVKHIEEGSPTFVEELNMTIDNIAIEEIKTKRCPLSVLRKLSSKGNIDYYEMWTVNELSVDFSSHLVV